MNDGHGSGRGPARQPRAGQLLERRVEERTHELSALLEVSRSINSTLALEPLLDLILDQLLRVIGYRSAGVFLARDDVVETVAMRDTRDATRDRSQVGDTVPIAGGLAIWQAMLRGEPVVIGDVRRDDDAYARAWRTPTTYEPDPTRLPVRACLAVPLSVRGQVFGLVALTRDVPDSFTARDTELALAFAGHAAVAIENARLLAESERRARELATLLEVSRGVASILELKPLLGMILDQLRVVADYTGSTVAVVEGEELVVLDDRGGDAPNQENPELAGVRVPLARLGLTWDLLSRRESVIIGDVWDDSPLARAYRQENAGFLDSPAVRHVRSWLAVPLVVKEGVIGYISISQSEPDYYTPHHAQLAMGIAAHVAAAIEHARLFEQERRTAEDLATLLEISRAVTSTLDLTPLLDLILDQARRVIDYRGATIGIVEGDEMLVAASRAMNPEREADKGLRVKLEQSGPIGTSILGKQPVIIADVRGDSLEAAGYRAVNAGLMDGPTHRDIRSWMAVPLVVKDGVIGHLTMSQDVPDYFTAHHAELALAVANQAAIAIENARLYRQATALAALQERQRLARELHDSVSQALFGIALGARTARRRLDLDPARVGESLDYVLSLADAALTEMRALIFELRPEALEKDGLVAALTRHAEATRARHEIAVETALCAEPDVPLATKEALYRIAQEAMHNAVKHARAARIDLVLACNPDGVTLEVRDDGVGFDRSRDFAGHLGLHSMRERMAAIGGTTDISSSLGAGTHIRATAPCG